MDSFQGKKTVVIIWFIACVAVQADASRITFKAYPDVLKANMTSAVAMRCELADTDVTRSVTNTTDDVAHVTSILITHSDGQVDVAQGSAFDAPTALVDIGNLEVKGDVTGASSVGYLELTWRTPSLMTLGEYACEIRTIDTHHHGTVFRSTLEMSVETPSINDIVVMLQTQQHHMKEQDAKTAAEMRDLQQKINNQTQENSDQNQHIINLTQKLQNQTMESNTKITNLTQSLNNQTMESNTKITNLTQSLNNQTQEIRSLQSDVTMLRSCTATKVAFMAVLSKTLSFARNQPIIFDKVLLNTDGGYSAQTGEFKCQTQGIYLFNVNCVASSSLHTIMHLQINSVTTTSLVAWYVSGNGHESGSASATVQLKKDDIVRVLVVYEATSLNDDSTINQANVFTGHLLHNDACLP